VSTTSERYGAPWLPDVYAVLFRGRYPVLHGNTDDLVRVGTTWMGLPEALTHVARAGGVELVGRLDVSRGLTFDDAVDADRFAELRRAAGGGRLPAKAGGGSADRAHAAFAQLDARDGPPAIGVLSDRGAALSAIRAVLEREAPRMAFIVDAPDLMLQDPGVAAASERRHLGEFRRLASVAQAGRHHIILVMRRDIAPPAWLTNSVPHLEPVAVPLPDRQERLLRLMADADEFYGAEQLSDRLRADKSQELAALADGLTLDETAALAPSSQIERLALAEPRRLISVARFGRRDVPLSITRERARAAPEELARRVVGQNGAVKAVTRALRAAASGVDAASDPEGSRRKPLFTLVFAGGTGVGKTELAKAIAELVFGDERALVRFDMSEFQQEHEVARLIGAPPGYVGHDAGGQLTRAVAGRPSTLLLFDEFEKADPRVLDLFIHVIDDGRLTDGNGRTVDFTGTGIVFTTNLGADIVYRRMRDETTLDYGQLEREVRSAIENRLRPELVGRLQSGIVVFDALSEDSVSGIAQKTLERLVLSAQRQAGLEVLLDTPKLIRLVRRELLRRGGEGGMAAALLTGGRAVESAVSDVVATALQEWIVDHDPKPGTPIRVSEERGEVRVHVAK
jgi:hypothetical protein